MNSTPAIMQKVLLARMGRTQPGRDPRRVPEEGAWDAWAGPGSLSVDSQAPGQTRTYAPGDSLSGKLHLGPHNLPFPTHPQNHAGGWGRPFPGFPGIPGPGTQDAPVYAPPGAPPEGMTPYDPPVPLPGRGDMPVPLPGRGIGGPPPTPRPFPGLAGITPGGQPRQGIPDMPFPGMAQPPQGGPNGVPFDTQHLHAAVKQLLGNTRSSKVSNIDALRKRFAQLAAAGALGRGR